VVLNIFFAFDEHVMDEIPYIPIIYGTTEFKKWAIQKDLKTNPVYN
jgi:hypothetical protein